MTEVYELKKNYTAQKNDVMARQSKDFMNIVYGKTVTKEIEESMKFVTDK